MMSSLKSTWEQLDSLKPLESKAPLLFIGHGNPMNAIQRNDYTMKWEELGQQLPRPNAILTISAHWLTRGSYVTAMERPRTIHDFSGFPPDLYKQQYPAPGSPEFAELTKKTVTATNIESDFGWGLDHGTWSFLLPMFPQANIPVYQLSLDYNKPMDYHYELAKQLSGLRDKGVMIIGSGNIVHNLRMANFFNPEPYDWTIEFDEKMKQYIADGDHQSIIHYDRLGNIAKLAVPTHDHYLPLIYSLAVQGKDEVLTFFNEGTDAGSISMRSFVSEMK
jgi:4,5-DOPA dioxygenase extradiol